MSWAYSTDRETRTTCVILVGKPIIKDHLEDWGADKADGSLEFFLVNAIWIGWYRIVIPTCGRNQAWFFKC